MTRFICIVIISVIYYAVNAQKSETDSLSKLHYKRTVYLIDSLKNEHRVYPVIVNNDTVFNIYEKVSSNSMSERALLCQQRVKQLLERDFFYRDSLKHEDSLDFILIKYADLTITEFGAITTQKLRSSNSQVTKAYKRKIITYLKKEQAQLLLNKTYKALIYIGLFIVLFITIRFIFSFLRKLIAKNDNLIYRFTHLLKIYQLKEEDKERAVNTVLKISKWLHILTVGLLIYFMLPAMLRIFYYTKSVGDKLISYFLNPFIEFLHSIIAYLPSLIKIIITIIIFRIFMKLVSFFFNELKDGNIKLSGFYKEWATPTGNIIKFLLYAFLLTILFPLLPGADSQTFKGVTVFLGLLISLGSTSVIANGLSGIIMTYMRPFKIGDRIEVDTVTGIVVQKNLLITRVRTPKNVIVTIPNSKILSGHSQNYTTAAERSNLIIHSTITIGYDVDWRTVHQLLLQAAKNTDGLIEQIGKETFVLQKSLDDYYVAYEVNAYTAKADKYIIIQSELHKNILEEFNKAGVEIMSPHYRANRDGEAIAIPDKSQSETPLPTAGNDEKPMDINEKINKKAEEQDKEA
ncbi:mechanosensitive ion channel family protein [Carboxylicivirga marina]|uniref:Mechanosensitive ion channel family protein n=1 Tax=Carboxylicivirga marina TaxID=2800988 RepID=A0ABS1HDW6_9BACT|nr:mechanosensitive ion channel family protein [Carboxylicivirga marina]MBK3515802.1 mechanosensitive ion channel family protein [Carboxylicivirga marina]